MTKTKRARRQAFTEVRVEGETAEPAALVEVVLANASVLRAPSGIEARQLRALIEVLESC